jgi:hypothetical protein
MTARLLAALMPVKGGRSVSRQCANRMATGAGPMKSWYNGLARILTVIVAVATSGAALAETRAGPHPLHIYLFWTNDVPFAVRANDFLTRMAAADPSIRLDAFEVNGSAENLLLFARVLTRIGTDMMRVPFTVIGSEVFVGFESDEVTGRDFAAKIESCKRLGCPDRLYDLLDPNTTDVMMGSTLLPTLNGFTIKVGADFRHRTMKAVK